MATARALNLGVRFLLELCALAALGYWGFQTGGSLPLKLVLGIGAPLVAATVWGAFVSPKAAVRVSAPVALIFEIAVFGSAAAALFASGQPTLAGAFALVALVSRTLKAVWRQ